MSDESLPIINRSSSFPRSMASIFSGFANRWTEYRGVVMRSQLEADFAYHLDKLGVQWSYEADLFGTPGSQYLPDFRLVDKSGLCYVELKPTVDQAEAAKARMTVIWESHPDAVLLVVSAQDSRWFAAVRGGPWETWTETWRHQ